MPTYEYECQACSHQFETLQGFNDKVLRTCPKCKKPKLQRLISGGGGLIFKGDGFYETDYKKPKKSETSESKSDSKSDSGSSDTAKSDKKDAKKTKNND